MASLTASSSSVVSVSASTSVIAQFKTPEGEVTGSQVSLPVDITHEQLEFLINELLGNTDEKFPYSFFVNEVEIVENLSRCLAQNKDVTEETVISIIYQPQAIFKVRAVTRCTGSLAGHSEAVLSVSFSPDGARLASGSGDSTVRIWDLDTETPEFTCAGHHKWVLCVAWSPDAKKLASGSMDQALRLWDPSTGKMYKSLSGHTQYITCLAWEPLHSNPKCSRVASGSKDGTVRIWDVLLGKCESIISGHTMSVTSVKWGGEGLIYTASQDRTIKIFAVPPYNCTTNEKPKLVRTLEAHAHWVNTLALSTDAALRTGCFDPLDGEEKNFPAAAFSNSKDPVAKAKERWDKLAIGGERLASGSDDNTICLWTSSSGKKPVARITGHQGPVNIVTFSPDGRILASASFDKSVRLWDGVTGKFITAFRNHVSAVYQVCWSSDSRLLVSGSKDSTLKVWDARTRKLVFDLPGHADEVFSVDWSPDGQRVASGSKDRLVKIWRH